MARDGEVVERNGQPKACLVPVSFLLPDIAPDRIAKELSKLDGKKENYKLTINDSKELEISCSETAAGENVVISIVLPHGYPNATPRIYAAQTAPNAPKRWPDGSLSIFARRRRGTSRRTMPPTRSVWREVWLKHYAKWRKTGEWSETTDAP